MDNNDDRVWRAEDWITWLDDLPLPEDFAEGIEQLQSFIADTTGVISATPTAVINRDTVAMSALQGMLAHSTRYRPRLNAPANWHVAIVQEAFEIANAFLAVRENHPTRKKEE
jgi:hypothetical protein